MALPNENGKSSSEGTQVNESNEAQSINIPRHTSFVNFVVCLSRIHHPKNFVLHSVGYCNGLSRGLSLWLFRKYHLWNFGSNHFHCQVFDETKRYSNYRWCYWRVRSFNRYSELSLIKY
jgi:hypothetical protein